MTLEGNKLNLVDSKIKMMVIYWELSSKMDFESKYDFLLDSVHGVVSV